jgi:hypothetical protein
MQCRPTAACIVTFVTTRDYEHYSCGFDGPLTRRATMIWRSWMTGGMRAEAAGDPRPWRQQALLGRAQWDADAFRNVVRDCVVETLGDPECGCRAGPIGPAPQRSAERLSDLPAGRGRLSQPDCHRHGPWSSEPCLRRSPYSARLTYLHTHWPASYFISGSTRGYAASRSSA